LAVRVKTDEEGADALGPPYEVLRLRPFALFWSAITIRALGTAIAGGIEDANDTGYRQAVAPDKMQGRMNSTIRTMNRVIFLFGALLAGVLATYLGYHPTIGIGAAIFGAAALVVAVSPLRNARHDDQADSSVLAS
jgi:MFS family permease